jgi:hypothetical protein
VGILQANQKTGIVSPTLLRRIKKQRSFHQRWIICSERESDEEARHGE